jgi:leucyl-tRNA synthetase
MASDYVESMIPSWRKAIAKAEAPPKSKKGQAAVAPPPKVKRADIFFSERFVGWQETTLRALAKAFDKSTGTFPNDTANQVLAAIKSDPGLAGGESEKALMKMVMPFAKFMMDKAISAGPMVLDTKLPFPEREVLEENLSYMMRSLNLEDIKVRSCSDEGKPIECDSATPGNPVLVVIRDD